MRWRVLFLSLALASVQCADDSEGRESRVVKISQGPVKGYRDPDTGVFVFYNIPYATTPTGSQRFKDPLPGPTWQQTLEAVDRGIVCPQPEIKGHELVKLELKHIQEDCLVATVYVPATEEKNLPVVIYVHGGAFQIGFGGMYPLNNFVKNNRTIAVTFNYRLGASGFLCLGTKDIPGNAGMKDQVALLRWVKNNIANFGGNPDDVALAGQSSGSICADLLMLSKAAEGLFNKVIPESGAGAGVVSVQLDPIENAKQLAIKLGFTDVDDFYALEDFYKSASMELLSHNYYLDNTNLSALLAPCVERDTGGEMILDDAPVNIIKSKKYKKLPILFGIDNMEGLIQMYHFETWRDKMNEKFSEFLPADLQFESETEKEAVAKTVKEFYFGNKTITEETILGYIDFYSDIMFVYATLWSVKLHVEAGHAQIYLYEYSFEDDNTPRVPYTNLRGAPHCAQSAHVLDKGRFSDSENESEEYKHMRNVIQEMWYNFIKTGKPVPEGSTMSEWPPVGKDRSPHMSLGIEAKLKGPLLEDRAHFWDEIYSKYYSAPLPPPAPPVKHNKLCSVLLLTLGFCFMY